MAEGDDSRLLLKVTGQLEHGGGEVLKADSTGLKILQRFVRRLNQQDIQPPEDDMSKESAAAALFDDLTMLPPDRRLRRITLSLAGRLPTTAELDEVRQNGDAAVAAILERVFQEDAFYERLKEGFNDIFLTIGIEDNAETLLSYHHFEKTRLWYQHWDFSNLPEAERERAGWKLADVYRDALLQEPLRMIEYIVRNDRPFTESPRPTTSWSRRIRLAAMGSSKASRTSLRIPMTRSNTSPQSSRTDGP